MECGCFLYRFVWKRNPMVREKAMIMFSNYISMTPNKEHKHKKQHYERKSGQKLKIRFSDFSLSRRLFKVCVRLQLCGHLSFQQHAHQLSMKSNFSFLFLDSFIYNNKTGRQPKEGKNVNAICIYLAINIYRCYVNCYNIYELTLLIMKFFFQKFYCE